MTGRTAPATRCGSPSAKARFSAIEATTAHTKRLAVGPGAAHPAAVDGGGHAGPHLRPPRLVVPRTLDRRDDLVCERPTGAARARCGVRVVGRALVVRRLAEIQRAGQRLEAGVSPHQRAPPIVARMARRPRETRCRTASALIPSSAEASCDE